MNKITVTVSGKAGSGKSTITELISRSLEVHGFHVTVKHIDVHEVDRPGFLRDLYKKITALSEKGTEINIIEKQESNRPQSL